MVHTITLLFQLLMYLKSCTLHGKLLEVVHGTENLLVSPWYEAQSPQDLQGCKSTIRTTYTHKLVQDSHMNLLDKGNLSTRDNRHDLNGSTAAS